jgi:hypothetical protein
MRWLLWWRRLGRGLRTRRHKRSGSRLRRAMSSRQLSTLLIGGRTTGHHPNAKWPANLPVRAECAGAKSTASRAVDDTSQRERRTIVDTFCRRHQQRCPLSAMRRSASIGPAIRGLGGAGLHHVGTSEERVGAQLARKVRPWTYHDLRRAAATKMGNVGIEPTLVEQALNHISGSQGDVAGIYNRYAMSVRQPPR